MMDLVQELEKRATSYDQSGPSAEHTAALLRKAKAEIERLSALWITETRENERLTTALRAIADYPKDIHAAGWHFHNIACVTLERPDEQEDEQEAEHRAEETHRLETAEMDEHFLKHPHG